MKSRYHQAVSLIIALICYYWTGSIVYSIFSFMTGVFIDIDHELDYYLTYKKITFSPTELCKNKEKSYLIFHSFEYSLVMIIMSHIFVINPIVFVSYYLHMIMDYSNSSYWYRYFIIYRIMYNWKNPDYVEMMNIAKD